MTFVVTENCIKCKYTDCVEVCPVDCFHEGPNFLVIDPDECIDCSLCEPECPANAIYAEEDLPESQADFLTLNAELSQDWPVITQQKDPLKHAFFKQHYVRNVANKCNAAERNVSSMLFGRTQCPLEIMTRRKRPLNGTGHFQNVF